MYTKIKTWLKSKKNGILALAFSVILIITLVIPCGAVWYQYYPENIGRSVSGRWLFSGGEHTGYTQKNHVLEGAYAISNDSADNTNPVIGDTFNVKYGLNDEASGDCVLQIDNVSQTITMSKSVPRHSFNDGNHTEGFLLIQDSFYYLFNFPYPNESGDNLNISFTNNLSWIIWDQHPVSHIDLSFTIVDLLSFDNGEFESYDITHSINVLDYYNASEDLFMGDIDFNYVVMSNVDEYVNLSLCRIDNLIVKFDFNNIDNTDSMPFDYSLSIDYDFKQIVEFVYKSNTYQLHNNYEINQFVVDMVYDEAYQEPIPIPPPTEQYFRSYVDWITTAVSGFFSFELFPGFYLGGLLVAIVAFCLVMWWLKMFGGG